MRTTTAPELAILADPTRQVTKRVKVANGSGTMIDLTSWLDEETVNIDIDRPVSALTVLFRRDSGTTLSLSPLRTDSTLNRLDDGTTYSPQLEDGRRLTWEVATTAVGVAPVAGDYKFLFDGYIDVIDFDHSPIAVDCRDKGSVLVDRGIEVEAAYGSTPGVALETVMQQNLDALFGSGFIPLDVPVSPSYLVSPQYIQQRQSEMDAQMALAQLLGWDVRYWHDSASNTFKFRLQNPPRTKTVPDYTFPPNTYYDITRLSIDRTNIKNVIAVSYFDTAANARLVVTVSDSASITKYGRRYFLNQEADGSPINTNTEATAMANAMLADLKDPKAEAEIELPFFWPAELWDLYRFTANGVHINSDQDWAVVSISHKLAHGHHRTVLTVRGKPAGGYLTWLDRGGIAGGEHRPGEVGPEAKIEIFGPRSGTQVNLLYTATGGTAPLSYQRRIDVDDVSTGTYSASALLGSGVQEWINVHPYQATRVFLRVIDATGLQGNADPFSIPGDLESVSKTTGRLRRPIPFDDGKYAVKASDSAGGTVDTSVVDALSRPLIKAFVKPLSTDPDTIDSVPNGSTYGRPLLTRLSGGKPLIDFSEGIHIAKTLDNIPDTGTRFAAVEANADHTASHTAAAIVNQGTLATLNTSAVSLSIGARYASNAGSSGPPYNQLEVPFTFSGMPTGTTYDVDYNNGVAGGVGSATGLTSSPATFTSVTFASTPGKGTTTVKAQHNGVTIAIRTDSGLYAF